MDHLVQEDVFQFVFREVELRADADAEIVELDAAEELAPLLVGAGAQTARGPAQFKRDGLQCTSEISVVNVSKRF